MDRISNLHDGRTTAAVTAGDGPPVVLIPGFLQSADRFIDTGWLDRLAQEFRVVAVDPPGFGDASKPHDLAAYEAQAFDADMVALLARLDIESAHLIGYSQGAGRACALAHRQPELVRSVVYGGSPLFDQGAQFRELGFDVDALFDQAITSLKTADWPNFWAVFPAPLSEDTKRFLESTNDPVSAGYVLEAARTAVPPFELPGVPIMAFWGSGENFHEANSEAAEALGIEAHVVDGEHDGAFVGVDAALAVIRPFLHAQ